MAVQAIHLAATAAHKHPVNRMTYPLLGYHNEKLSHIAQSLRTSVIYPPHYPPGINQGGAAHTLLSLIIEKEKLYGRMATKLLFFIQFK